MAQSLLLVAAVAVVVLMVGCGCHGAVYKVGDSAGWTTLGNVDYKQWAATKTFQLGDIILFQYNNQFHNVMQVTHAEFRACNTTSPKATYTTGNDSITITRRGHHFFFCGVPGHCQAGQKVDINVPRNPIKAQPAAAPASPTSVPTASRAPGPSSNGHSNHLLQGSSTRLGFFVVGIAIYCSVLVG